MAVDGSKLPYLEGTMTDRRYGKPLTTMAALLAITISLQMPQLAMANDTDNLKPENASIDSAQPNSNVPPAAEHTALFGSARKHQELEDPNQKLNGNVSDNGANLQAEQAANDTFKLAAQKLVNRQALSAEEYRALGVGCTGFEADHSYFTNDAKVSVVYPGSPADEAGIKEGDHIVYDQPENAQTYADPSVPQWRVTLARAGTPLNVTLKRHGKREPITLVRMNIEDIKDAKYRHRWEQIVRNLGGQPQDGTYTGTSMKNMRPGD